MISDAPIPKEPTNGRRDLPLFLVKEGIRVVNTTAFFVEERFILLFSEVIVER